MNIPHNAKKLARRAGRRAAMDALKEPAPLHAAYLGLAAAGAAAGNPHVAAAGLGASAFTAVLSARDAVKAYKQTKYNATVDPTSYDSHGRSVWDHNYGNKSALERIGISKAAREQKRREVRGMDFMRKDKVNEDVEIPQEIKDYLDTLSDEELDQLEAELANEEETVKEAYRDIIQGALDENPAQVQDAVNDILAQKMTDKLDTMYAQVAQSAIPEEDGRPRTDEDDEEDSESDDDDLEDEEGDWDDEDDVWDDAEFEGDNEDLPTDK